MVSNNHDAADESGTAGFTRRQWLAIGSSAAISGIAGCGSGQNPNETPVTAEGDGTSSSDSSSTNSDSSSQGGDPVTTTMSMRAPVSWTPKNSNINPFATQGDIEYWMEYMWWESPVYPNAVGETMYWVADEINVVDGGCAVEIKLRDDYTWWDGSPVTAQDYYTTKLLQDYKENGGPDQTDDSWELVDDYTVKNILSGPANPSTKKSEYYTPIARHSYFKSWLEKFQDAGNENGIKEVANELNTHKITLQDVVDNDLGAGLWKPTQMDPTQVVHKKYQDHPRADWTNLDTFHWRLISEKQKAIQALRAGQLDYGDKTVNQALQSNSLEEFSNFSIGGMPKLTMNFNNEHLARRPVRRAIAYLVDSEEVVKVIKSSHGIEYGVHEDVIGMSKGLSNQWLDDSFLSNLINYGTKSQPEKAKETLEAAGYSKQGGVWADENGSKIEGLKYLTPPWNIYKTVGKYFSPKLNEFGIDNKLIIPSSSGFWKRWSETFDFDLANWFTYASHPAYAYSCTGARGIGIYRDYVEQSESSSGGSCQVDRSAPTLTRDTSEKLGHKIRPQFPSEVGSMEMSGSGQTLEPIKWNNIMTQTQSREEVVDLTKKLAWFMNWQVPHVGFYDEVKTYWGNTNKFNFPVPGEPGDYPNAERVLPEHKTTAMEFFMKGLISAKTK
ncbi:ABC transporter substrate-binding protein [Haloprofundus marisrubri]|uniref:ABC transporter substrate-binding protein n=1 Tax=Haloprofundus marisrubri TaxID=1514971 RepID=A0A0W1RDX3_9EURY|nr:ABC transporter substrate-binding protein [Haloprofundus marisrubri]KTG11467.1 ABC transporter substrate-binding protein [Haloprofundus marisrubri]